MMRAARRAAFLILAAAIAAGGAGCYRRVVREGGIADRSDDVYEPNRKPGLIDALEDAIDEEE